MAGLNNQEEIYNASIVANLDICLTNVSLIQMLMAKVVGGLE